MFKMKRLLPLLFSLVLLFCSVLPVQAQTVSSGDALYANEFVSPQMMSLSGSSNISVLSDNVALAAETEPILKLSSFAVNPIKLNYNSSFALLEEGTTYPSNSMIFNYQGTFTLTFLASIQDWEKPVVADGYINLPILLERADTENVAYHRAQISIVNVSAPDSVSAGINPQSYGDSYKFLLRIGFNGYEFTDDKVPISVTFNMSQNCLVASGNYSGELSNIGYTATLSDYTSYITMHESWDSKTNTDINSGMTNIINMLGIVRDNIITYGRAIEDTINLCFTNLFSNMQTLHNDLVTNIGTIIDSLGAFRSEVLNYYNGMISNLSTWFTTLFEKMDEDQEELINGYDPGTGSAAKNEFDSSAAELEAAEGDLFGQTSYDQVDYTQFNSFFSIEAVAASMLFVKSILESLYGALGVFGVPITIGLVLLVFTRIIGFQNFYSGGD